MIETPANLELLEPPAPDALVPNPLFGLWILLAVILLVIATSAWLIVRSRNKNAVPDPRQIRNQFHQEALAALEKITAPHARDAAVQSSLVLRKYLSLAANDPALFETHEEFIARHDALSVLTQEARAASDSGFARLASLKYSAGIPDVGPVEVVDESRALLETLHHGFMA
jgi:hypothetical protein